MQPIKLSSAAGWCAGRGCALIRQLANCPVRCCYDKSNTGGGFGGCSRSLVGNTAVVTVIDGVPRAGG